MKVAIVAPSPVPYTPGGAEAVWSGLLEHLAQHTDHDAELVTLSVRETTLPEVMDAYRAFADLDLDRFDVVISGKYPAWMVRHPRHVVYLLHPLRGLYDSYGLFHRPFTETSTDPGVRGLLSLAATLTREDLPELFERWRSTLERLGPDHPVMAFPGPFARSLVRAMDAMALAPSQVAKHGAISWTVAGREGYFPDGAAVHVVHPPSDLAGLHAQPGEFFFTASRHDAPKRLDLLIRAMRHYPGERRLLIAGSGPQSDDLARLAADDPRIELVGRLAPDRLVGHYARAVGVPFIPFDEDLGLITYEAMASGKPVLTTSDSGGPMEFVEPGRTGVVVAPEPEAIGAGLAELEHLAEDPTVAERTRAAVRRQSWERVAEVLLDERPARRVGRRAPAAARRGKPRLVVVSTFPFHPPTGGGQLRSLHLYGGLTDDFDIEVVSQASGRPPSTTVLRPGMVEHVVPRTPEHEKKERWYEARALTPVTDIVAARLTAMSPAYGRTLERALDGAAGVLLAHPFLAPVVADLAPDLPTVYDAHNCELALKTQVLRDGPLREQLLAEVREVEALAARRSRLVLTVSDEDRRALAEAYDLPADRFVAAPNGTDLATVPYVAPAERRRRRDAWLAAHAEAGGARLRSLALFLGSWHEPNNAAARHLVEVARSLPDVGFLMVGSHVRALAGSRPPRNVLTLGVVPDRVKEVLLGAADVALAPLTTGSGTNLKVVEYLAAGLPVVSTPLGLRGLELPDGAAVVVEIDEFARGIRDVLAAPASDESLERVAAGVRATYDWRVIAAAVAPAIGIALGLES